MQQDDFYLKKEANTFFDRWNTSEGKNYDGKIRESKKLILTQLEENINLSNEAIDILKDVYKKDFENFSYENVDFYD